MLLQALLPGTPPVEPLLLLLAALVLDALFGDMRRLPGLRHPVVLIGSVIGWLDRRLNREYRSERDRAWRGVLMVVVIVSVTAAVGLLVTGLTWSTALGWVLEVLLIAWLLAQRSLFNHVRVVRTALAAEGLSAGRQAVSHIVGRDVRLLDEHGVARAAIESAAENFNDGVVAPTFWYLLFGLPGLLVYKAVNTMDSMVGYRTPRYRAFGMAAARLDDGMNLVPARLAGLYLCLAAAFVPRARPAAALRVMIRDSRKHRSPNAGWPEAAAAGALGLALAGPRRYADTVVDDPWIGDGRSRATVRDIDRVLYLYAVACLISVLVIGGVAAARLGLQ
ncbi:MAG: cobalamin biosynthesis protein CobD [Rhodospirillales bacterium]|nr:MAG: cobalamin biosynthesis protein CobD [Rhodospirillales bacterium]